MAYLDITSAIGYNPMFSLLAFIIEGGIWGDVFIQKKK